MYVSGLASRHLVSCKLRLRRKRPAPAVREGHTAVFCDAVQREKAGIVRGELIFDTGVAETNDQFHAALPLCEQLRG